ncbi:MAG: molybdopterin-binding protein [Desulfovermiculus sp.]
MYRKVDVEQAVGMVLGHDITQILPNRFKGPALKKGHVIQQSDIPLLLSLGKQQVYVLHLGDGYVHEDEAARRIAAAAAGAHLSLGSPSEGKVNLIADAAGLLTINTQLLDEINAVPDVMLATIHSQQMVSQGQSVAGTRIIPLVVPQDCLRQVEAICAQQSVVDIQVLKSAKVGLITTGSEVYKGLIEDGFAPVVRRKFEQLGSTILEQVLVSDELDMTIEAIYQLLEQGADFIALTGGMSVDPDDQTPAAIRASGADVVTYGAPVLPGAMFMLAWLNGVPIVGLPGCVMYYQASIFDLVVPRLLAGEQVTEKEIRSLAHGGMCMSCPTCRFPLCGFGKG